MAALVIILSSCQKRTSSAVELSNTKLVTVSRGLIQQARLPLSPSRVLLSYDFILLLNKVGAFKPLSYNFPQMSLRRTPWLVLLKSE